MNTVEDTKSVSADYQLYNEDAKADSEFEKDFFNGMALLHSVTGVVLITRLVHVHLSAEKKAIMQENQGNQRNLQQLGENHLCMLPGRDD